MGSSYEKGDCDDHGVSDKWIRDRVVSGSKKASSERIGQFKGRMSGAADAQRSKATAHRDVLGSTAGKTARHADRAEGKRLTAHNAAPPLNKKSPKARAAYARGLKQGHESGWDKWKAKKGHKMGFGLSHGYDDGEETYGNDHEYK